MKRVLKSCLNINVQFKSDLSETLVNGPAAHLLLNFQFLQLCDFKQFLFHVHCIFSEILAILEVDIPWYVQRFKLEIKFWNFQIPIRIWVKQIYALLASWNWLLWPVWWRAEVVGYLCKTFYAQWAHPDWQTYQIKYRFELIAEVHFRINRNQPYAKLCVESNMQRAAETSVCVS